MRTTSILLLLILNLIGCSNSIDPERIKGNPSFIMTDKLIGTIVQSTDKNKVGKQLIFTGMTRQQPEITTRGGGFVFQPYKKFDDEKLLRLSIPCESKGSGINTYLIDKKKGTFSHISGAVSSSPHAVTISIGVFN